METHYIQQKSIIILNFVKAQAPKLAKWGMPGALLGKTYKAIKLRSTELIFPSRNTAYPSFVSRVACLSCINTKFQEIYWLLK